MQDITAYLVQIFTSAGIAGLVACLAVWITRLWLTEGIKNSIRIQFEEKLETHKAQLKAQSDVELERLRSQLRDASAERNIVFSRLHEQRANTIAETYSCLKELHICLSEYVKVFEMAGGPSKEERYKKLVAAHEAFFESFAKRLIFFPEETARKLNGINQAIVETGNEFRLFVELRQSPNSTEDWVKLEKRVRTEIEETLLALEKDFRVLLGDKGGASVEE